MDMPNLGNLMKEAQKMQERMQKAQEDLSRLEVDGESGGGLVRICINGRHEAMRVSINPSLLEEDISMLEDLVASAFNDAVRKVEKASKARIAELTAGINIPADFMQQIKDSDKE